jgi:hypothetical protein
MIFNSHFSQKGLAPKSDFSIPIEQRKKGFQEGQTSKTVFIDPILQRPYRVMIIDTEIQRREKLADCMEKFVEIFMPLNFEKALSLFEQFTIDLCLIRMSPCSTEKDTSFIELQKEMIKKHIRTPIAYLVHHAVEQKVSKNFNLFIYK